MINQIKNIFPIDGTFSSKDKFESFDLEYLTNLNDTNKKTELESLFQKVNDDWLLNIVIENFDHPIQLKSIDGIENFLKKINDEKKTIEDEKINLKLQINKKNKQQINVYDEESFFKNIEEQNITQFLDSLVSLFSDSNSISFKTFESEQFSAFSTKHIFFNYKVNTDNSKLELISDNCYYANKNEYPFSPSFFLITKNANDNNSFVQKLRICNMIYNLIAIADYSEIKNNELSYKIIGYRTFEGKFKCGDISLNSTDTYSKIYNWAYSDKGNINDKLGLIRNILSIYLKQGSIDIEEDAFHSVQSGYKTYIQGNLNKYIDLRSKITDQLELINQKANSSIEHVLNNYQKSSYAFISFFISIFVLRVLAKGDFENVFTKDASIILIILIGISVLYLFYSLWLFNSEKKRLKNKYVNLKNRFEDLLIKEDINKILREDEEFNDEIDFIVKKRNAYTVLWIVTILLFISLLLSLSSYINWNSLFNSSTQ